MLVVLSGEGPTDLGVSQSANPISEAEDYLPGPLAWMIDHILEAELHYSIIESHCCVLVSKGEITKRAGKLRSRGKTGISLPGKKKPKETGYFYRNARALALIAAELSQQKTDEAIAILFRDSDGTASGSRGIWEEKRQSVIKGFAAENYAKGVAMIPRPKSEAWLLCALRARPYSNCDQLEQRSGNDNSPNSLKDELDRILTSTSRESLSALVVNRTIDCDKIRMTSFDTFRADLLGVL